jgi:hypothetical protein
MTPRGRDVGDHHLQIPTGGGREIMSANPDDLRSGVNCAKPFNAMVQK